MEFLSLSHRRSSARKVPSGEERGETDVFAGYHCYCVIGSFKKSPLPLNKFSIDLCLKALEAGCYDFIGNLQIIFALTLKIFHINYIMVFFCCSSPQPQETMDLIVHRRLV